MKLFKETVLIVLFFVLHSQAESKHRRMRHELSSVYDQLHILKTIHEKQMKELRDEIDELKKNRASCKDSTDERNEKLTLEWTRNSIREVREELRETVMNINSSAVLQQLHTINNQIQRLTSESNESVNLNRLQEARTDKLDNVVERLKYEKKEDRALVEKYRSDVVKLSKEFQAKTYPNVDMSEGADEHLAYPGDAAHKHKQHRYRHSKMIHAQIARLAKAQEQIDHNQQTMQTQMLDHDRRLDRLEEPNVNLLTARVDLHELDFKVISDRLNNITMAVSDFEKIHVSTLELREEVENFENKIDNILPEFRKEISKLDVSVTQINARLSYEKEDQENLRKSVKAIAVSVSNAMDRAECDREDIREINTSISNLEKWSKQHYHRLNDHIQKSEINQAPTEIVPLRELMVEVKELQPVEREYEDLVGQLPRDCSTVSGPDGVYLIHPGHTPLDVYCSNGSTVAQRRYNGTEEFNRKFADYATGFGDPTGELWLGLDTMHQLTADNCTAMRIDMTDIYGKAWYAQYYNFFVGSADTGYVLEVGGFKGNSSDAFAYQNRMEFSAIDRDRDISNTHCAANYEGGWWYSHCQHVNINGKYTLGLTWFDGKRNEWIAVATSEMRFFRKHNCA